MEIDVQAPLKLHMDSEAVNQPENTYSFALNVLDGSKEGSKGARVNELGNTLCLELDNTYAGAIRVDENNIAVFIKPSKIILLNPNTCGTILFDIDGLNFGDKVTGESRIVRGCEKVVYFRDGVNPDRFFNFDRVDDFKTAGNWDTNKFAFIPQVIYPVVETSVKASGGRLNYGTYFFVLEYLDESENVRYKTLPQGRVEIGANLNIDSNLPEIGGRPLSNESIQITVTDLDTSFDYFRITVIQAKGNNNSLLAHTIGNIYPITSNTHSFLYTGYDPEAGDYLIDKNEVLTPTAVYDSSNVMLQVQNHLLRMNLKEPYIDYSTYQRFASKINTNYEVNPIPKGQETRYDFTEEADEVKAYFIHYINDKGQISPAFHIPGRNLIPGEDELISYKGELIPKWKIKNTSTLYTTRLPNTSLKFGYYQCDNLYNNPPNLCSDIDYWGVDSDGIPLLGKNIRHHKIPDRNIIPLIEDGNLNFIGVKFSNVEYPDASIVGHFFSSASANEVVSSGLALTHRQTNVDNDEGWYFHTGINPNPFENFDGKVVNLLTWDYLFKNTTLTGDYISYVGEYDYSFSALEESEDRADITVNRSQYSNYFNDNVGYDDLYLYFHLILGLDYNPILSEQIPITDYRNLRKLSRDAVKTWKNESLSTNWNLLELESKPTVVDINESKFHYVHVKNFSTSLCNLNAINPRILHDRPFVSTSLSDEFILYAGENRISTTAITNIAWLSFNFGFAFGDDVKVDSEFMVDFYMESPIYAPLRLNTTDACNSFYTKGSDYIKYTINRVVDHTVTGDKTGMVVRDSVCEEWYGYNFDYNKLNDLRKFKTLPLSYDYCSDCLNIYPNRIAFSPVSFEDDIDDKYLINRVNDYIDIPANRGEIIGASYRNNQIVIRTTETCFFIQPNPQTLQTNTNTVYIGTGDFLSLPSNELNKSDIGYAGQQDILASCNTPYGDFWVDNSQGKIFKLFSDFSEITNQDVYHFCRNELPPKKPFGIDVSTTQLTYDNEFRRLIISKKDYVPTESLLELSDFVEYTQGTFTLFGSSIDLDNKAYFENKSFTLSYDILNDGFKGFHSYLPERVFYSNNTFFTTYDNKIWKHNTGKYQTYYDKSYPYIIEFVVKDWNTFYTHAVHYFTNVYEYNSTSKTFIEKDLTFDKMVVYSDNQSTGIVNLNLLNNSWDNVNFSNLDKYVIESDGDYKVAQIRDIAIATPVYSKNWTDINQYYDLGQGYMDKEPINVDFNKHQFELSDIKDKAVKVRLIFNQSDYKIVTHLLQTMKFYSK